MVENHTGFQYAGQLVEKMTAHNNYDDIQCRIVAFYKNPTEQETNDLTRVLFYLDREEKSYKDDPLARDPPVIRTLRSAMQSENLFKTYVNRLIEETKQEGVDPEFHQYMRDLYSGFMDPSEERIDNEGWQLERIRELSSGARAGIGGFFRVMSTIPPGTQLAIMRSISNFVNNRHLMKVMEGGVGIFERVGSTVATFALAAVFLTWDAIHSIHRWWRGQISGIRCVKNIIDSALSTAAGVGGGFAGAVLGAFVGPVGMLIGGVIVGYFSATVANLLSDRMTQWLFGLPKSEALENAYKYLGVGMKASNGEINTAFRDLCLKHHPDKGGSSEEFFVLQNNMAVIKASRNELLS
jgi:hypothetical protein